MKMQKPNFKSFLWAGACALAAFLALPKLSLAADFYVDPVNGSMANDGSQAHPWSTMQAVWDACKIQTQTRSVPYNAASSTMAVKCPNGPVHAGDTIYLQSGYQGSLKLLQGFNSDYITIKAAPGAEPHFKNISMIGVSKWIFDGIAISPSFDPVMSKVNLFSIDPNSWHGPSDHVTLKNSNLFSVPDISGYAQADWDANISSGISISYGEYTIIDNVRVSNTRFGVAFSSSNYSELKNSIINNFGDDGLRVVQSDYSKIEYNTIKNAYYLNDGNHADLIQSWTTSGTTTGVEIRGNTLIAHENLNQPFFGSTQGIGFFDGFFKDYVIENNLIITGHYHGISVYGAINCRVLNNTVVYDPNDLIKGSPINIRPHKNGQPAVGNLVRNNISGGLSMDAAAGISDHNLVLYAAGYGNYFANPAAFDYHPKATSTAVNAGSAEMAPFLDRDQRQRDALPDLGAYEYAAAASVSRSDVNSSGKTDSVDALLILRKSLGLTVTGWNAAAGVGDVNCDGNISSADSLLVLRYAIGLSMSGTAWCQ